MPHRNHNRRVGEGFGASGRDELIPAQPEFSRSRSDASSSGYPFRLDGAASTLRFGSFNFALRAARGALRSGARLLVVVGDHCDIDSRSPGESWSERFNIAWERVPDPVFNEAGIWGTANWRLNIPAGDAEIIFLADADTVLLRDIDRTGRPLSARNSGRAWPYGAFSAANDRKRCAPRRQP